MWSTVQQLRQTSNEYAPLSFFFSPPSTLPRLFCFIKFFFVHLFLLFQWEFPFCLPWVRLCCGSWLCMGHSEISQMHTSDRSWASYLNTAALTSAADPDHEVAHIDPFSFSPDFRCTPSTWSSAKVARWLLGPDCHVFRVLGPRDLRVLSQKSSYSF